MAVPDPELISRMHRFFAVECNNRAWELTEQSSRSEEEAHEMRTTAHAAAFHWAKVGMPVNEMRARLLLAEVAAQDGNGPLALALAKSCCDFFENEEGTGWDRAFSTLELAYAHAVCGQEVEVSPLLEKASAQGEQLAEKGERDFFTETRQRISGLIEQL